MYLVDQMAERVGLVRGFGEVDGDLLYRIKIVYKQRPYDKYFPLLQLLYKLGIKDSTRYLWRGMPK